MAADDEDEGEFADFFPPGLRPGRAISLSGKLRYRQGSDSRDWADPGGQKYVPLDWIMQCGCVAWTGTARTYGAVEVTFPARFSGTPVVLATPVNTAPPFEDIRLQACLSSAAGMEIHWHSAVGLTRVEVCWLALGPMGV